MENMTLKIEDVPNADPEEVIQSSLIPCYKKLLTKGIYNTKNAHTQKKTFSIAELPKEKSKHIV
jgi:hypothetical protein